MGYKTIFLLSKALPSCKECVEKLRQNIHEFNLGAKTDSVKSVGNKSEDHGNVKRTYDDILKSNTCEMNNINESCELTNQNNKLASVFDLSSISLPAGLCPQG